MTKILNDSIMPLVDGGRIAMNKIEQLIEIKEFIDRVSSKKYLGIETVESMTARYGAAPDIFSWGDYFQSDLAMAAVQHDDEEFSKIVETVRFDIMSAWDICSSNGPEFFEWVDDFSTRIWLSGREESEFNEEEKEAVHLKVLTDYFTDMGLNGNFYESELIWYHAFFDAQGQVYSA